MGEVKTNTVVPFFANLFSILIIIVGGYFWGFWGVVIAKLNNVLTATIVRTFTYNKVFGERDYLIGLRMMMPLLLLILIYELTINLI